MSAPPDATPTQPHAQQQPQQRVELRFESSGAAFSGVIAPSKVLDSHLAEALRKPQLLINSTW